MDKTIISLCDYSGNWSKPYKDNGFNVIQVDLHLAQDIRLFKKIKKKVYGILAAPPCTEFAGSGARWWKNKNPQLLFDNIALVDACFRIIVVHNPKFWVLENPVGRLVHWIGKPKYIFNPCDYGDAYTKKTCLWGNFNIPKKNPVDPKFIVMPNGKRMSALHYFGSPKTRATKRGITPMGFAKAFYEANCNYE
tara:strand:- start:2 stop:580 length:579 start_codon:yes stop_codon:yes gene_type:complete